MVFCLPSGCGWSEESKDNWEEDEAVEETKWYGEKENLQGDDGEQCCLYDDDDNFDNIDIDDENDDDNFDEHSIDDDEEDLEESDEDMGVGETAESESEEGGETPVEHCRT